MGVIDIICGIVLILASIMIIALVSMQESKSDDHDGCKDQNNTTDDINYAHCKPPKTNKLDSKAA